ncbi:unnamed protein product [Vitrella brassicaformis CCMP3155]|uniref:Uncharacterized protein n=1 Tax=Vitrella brassicaformis (strain CCMP3155) TaxID=1169540 RepID=A0A0G4FKS3_VITBC|nr:unnamed protein product [Vitrella brassicaformis CCMP3155]|eukprot:CEM14231.1 unnamed protein product [Vitrella brassicaformis CCMP3155]
MEPSGERRLWRAGRSPGPMVVFMEAEEGDQLSLGNRRARPSRQTRWSQQPTHEGQLYYERETRQPPFLPSSGAPFGHRPAASVQTYRAPPSSHPAPCDDKAAVGHDVREAVSDKPVLRCVCFDWLSPSRVSQLP